MPERSYSSSAYRYAFNGQEKDDDVAGSGNINTAEFWEYDCRLGRRWNLDPKPSYGISEYSCFLNNPLWFYDPYGDTIRIKGSVLFKSATKIAIGIISQTTEGKRIISALQTSTEIYTIASYRRNKKNKGKEEYIPNSINSSGGTIYWSGKRKDLNKVTLLFHELGHAEDDENHHLMALSLIPWITPDQSADGDVEFKVTLEDGPNKGELQTVNKQVDIINESEASAMDKENKFRAQAGFPMREYYGTQKIVITSPGGVIIYYEKVHKIYQVCHGGIGTHPNFNTNYNLIQKESINYGKKYNKALGSKFISK